MKIIAVDDEPLVLKLISLILQKVGLSVDCYESGTIALEAFRSAYASEDAFKLAIVDLTLVDVLGEELIQRLRDIDPTVKVVIISGLDEGYVEEHAQAIGEGCVKLVKPFTPDQLQQIVNELLDL